MLQRDENHDRRNVVEYVCACVCVQRKVETTRKNGPKVQEFGSLGRYYYLQTSATTNMIPLDAKQHGPMPLLRTGLLLLRQE